MSKQVSDTSPWLMPEVIDWLDWIVSGMRYTVLETGAGGSTVFFARRVEQLITYEHTPQWAAVAAKAIGQAGLQHRVTIRFLPNYPTAGLGRPIPPIDLAFIDGRGRVRGVIDVLPFIKPGGWLVLDDSNRTRYDEAKLRAGVASSSKIVWSDNEGNETTAWKISTP